MRPWPLISTLAFAACLQPYVATPPFGMGSGTTAAEAGSTGAAASSTGGTSSSGHVPEDSSVGSSAGTTPVLDVGAAHDLTPPQPVGCQGRSTSCS